MMFELFPVLIALACPLGMVTMMFLPALGRRFARRTQSTAEYGPSTGAGGST